MSIDSSCHAKGLWVLWWEKREFAFVGMHSLENSLKREAPRLEKRASLVRCSQGFSHTHQPKAPGGKA